MLSPDRSSSAPKSIVFPPNENVPKAPIPPASARASPAPSCLSAPHPLAAPQQPLQSCQQDRKIKRLRQIIVGPGSESLQHVFRTSHRRQHQHRHIIARGAQLRDHAESVFARKHDVEHDRIEIFILLQQAIGCRFSVSHHFRRIAFRFEVEAQSLRQMRLILHHQHPAHAAHLGSSSTIVVPCPSPPLSANTLPPCFCAIAFTINRPSPVPFTCASERCVTR